MHENGIEEMSAFHFSNTLTSSWRHQNSGAWNLFVTFFFMTNFQLNFLTLGLSSGEVPSQAMAESGERREQTDFLAPVREINADGSSKATQTKFHTSVNFTHPHCVYDSYHLSQSPATQVIPRRKVHTQSVPPCASSGIITFTIAFVSLTEEKLAPD